MRLQVCATARAADWFCQMGGHFSQSVQFLRDRPQVPNITIFGGTTP